MNNNISIIGGGAMGKAMASGLLGSNDKSLKLYVSNPHLDKIADLEKQGVTISDNNPDVITDSGLICIAVKPWIVNTVIEEIKPFIQGKNIELCLIVAGIHGDEILKKLEGTNLTDISIVMPNTAMRIGKSMTFIVPLKGECIFTRRIFEKVGEVKIIQERLLPAATALASCGIAYGMRYVRAATEGGVELGFYAHEAQQIVAQTLNGVVGLLNEPDAFPEKEIDKVTTPGGLTIKGLNAMEKAGFSNAVIEGLKAGR